MGSGLGGRHEVVYKKEERSHQDLLSLPRMGAENEERPKQVVCHRTEDETVRLGLEERGT